MKAILVMEMPKSCSKCPLFCGHYSDMACRGNHRTIEFPYPDNKVQEWRPLIEIPEGVNHSADELAEFLKEVQKQKKG